MEPHLPAPCLTGRPRAWPMRGIGERDLLRAPIRLRLAALARQLPRRQTVYGWFLRLRDDCVLERLNHHLVMLDRARAAGAPPALRRGCSTAKASRRRRPAGRGATTPARRSRAESATPSSTPTVVPWCWSLTRPTSRTATAAGARAGGLAPRLSLIAKVFADSGYAGKRVAGATAIAVEIVRKNPDQVGFAVQPRRWVVERFFAWIGRNRRLAKDFEATLEFRPSLPLRRLHHAAHPTARAIRMSFESDSQ